MVILTPQAYRDRLCGSWLGALAGAAAGLPLDGERRPADVADVGDLLPRARPLPAEAVTLPRLWLETLRATGPGLGPDGLVRAWLDHVRRADGEYGFASANLHRDLLPPVSGVHDNPFRESLGALARADLWGRLAPGDPATAARYAWQDAILDHAGCGVVAAVVLAGLVSAAFAELSPERLLETALRLAPRDSRTAQVLRDVARWHGELANWRRTREMLLRSYGSEDVRDSTVAIGLVALSLLDGEGEFARSLLTAARCGWSTTSVCGAVGAVVGAMHGEAGLPEPWRRLWPPEVDLAGLVDLTYDVGCAVVAAECDGRCRVQDGPPEEESRLLPPNAEELLQRMAMGPYVVAFPRAPLDVLVDYETTPTIGYDQPRRLSLGLLSRADRAIDLRARLIAPAGFVVVANTQPISLAEDGTVSFSASLTAPREHCEIAAANQCVLFLAIEDEPEVAVPITLAGESLWYAAGPFGDFDAPHEPESPALLAGRHLLGEEGWRRLSVAEPAVSLLTGMEGEQGTYYLATDLFAAGATPACARIGGNDGLRVWLNGQQVLSHHEHRPADARVNADTCNLDLRDGWNRLVIKMAQCSPRRFLSFALCGRDGHLLPDPGNTRLR